ncbi:hypothetical protein HMPREF0653_01444 [Prevotella disiens JCM 6334 = ATCC 29426]|uniref:Uncharacterized protein n=1 Tax=Prevotella disiens JCM 6334 = ATCC 29426 TaxID=1235811 RepID=A0ABN0NS89_9BACT|nr:hypothetical protein HMPREF0653_01444 [Prevotella disiens JCM 6334 = ATCC 29426]
MLSKIGTFEFVNRIDLNYQHEKKCLPNWQTLLFILVLLLN